MKLMSVCFAAPECEGSINWRGQNPGLHKSAAVLSVAEGANCI